MIIDLLAAMPSLYDNLDTNNLSLGSIYILIANIIRILLAISGTLAVIIIVFSGMKYVVAQGDSGKVKSAKDTMLNAIIGLILAAASYLIVTFVAGRFG